MKIVQTPIKLTLYGYRCVQPQRVLFFEDI